MNPIVRSIMLEQLEDGVLIHPNPHFDVITKDGKAQYTPDGIYGAVMVRLYPEVYRYATSLRIKTYGEEKAEYFKIAGPDGTYCVQKEITKPAWRYLFGEPYIIQNERIKHDLRRMPPMGCEKIKEIIRGSAK